MYFDTWLNDNVEVKGDARMEEGVAVGRATRNWGGFIYIHASSLHPMEFSAGSKVTSLYSHSLFGKMLKYFNFGLFLAVFRRCKEEVG